MLAWKLKDFDCEKTRLWDKDYETKERRILSRLEMHSKETQQLTEQAQRHAQSNERPGNGASEAMLLTQTAR